MADFCEDTGVQKSLRAYLRRVAIPGRDPRGGADEELESVPPLRRPAPTPRLGVSVLS